MTGEQRTGAARADDPSASVTIRLDAEGHVIPPPEHVARMRAIEAAYVRVEFTAAFRSVCIERTVAVAACAVAFLGTAVLISAEALRWVDVARAGARAAVAVGIAAFGCLALAGLVGTIVTLLRSEAIVREWTEAQERFPELRDGERLDGSAGEYGGHDA